MTEPFVPESKRSDFPQMLPLAWSDCVFLFYTAFLYSREQAPALCVVADVRLLYHVLLGRPAFPGTEFLALEKRGLISQVHVSPLLQLPSCVQIRPSHFCWKTLQCQKFLMLTPPNVRNLLGKSVSPEEKNVHSVSGGAWGKKGKQTGVCFIKMLIPS